MRSLYAIKITTIGKRPTPQTPLEPMLIQLGNGEALALFEYPEPNTTTPAPSGPAAAPPSNRAARALPEVDLDQDCKVNLEVKTPDMTKKEQECVFTFKLKLN